MRREEAAPTAADMHAYLGRDAKQADCISKGDCGYCEFGSGAAHALVEDHGLFAAGEIDRVLGAFEVARKIRTRILEDPGRTRA